ncbi:MAG TPA: class I SAM-dependent methyltransferase [Candidatus Polarisedimenticolia bacterium]|nr:class I SAM-dependent methyltransferase [Candidatus Polarisedimenticolia bacterium]
MPTPSPDPFEAWVIDLERRQLADLTFGELRRALAALSSLYVERRGRLGEGAALEGAGKRAAFALFYGPLHFLTVRGVVRALAGESAPPKRIIDLGCGTGVAGAAWALECDPRPAVTGWERSAWAITEARWCFSRLRVRGILRRGDFAAAQLGGREDAVLAAFAINELDAGVRESLLEKMIEASRRGARVLVVEPIARRGFSWWDHWAATFQGVGGREDSWRFPAVLPDLIRRLDEASGMDHRELTARSLCLNLP